VRIYGLTPPVDVSPVTFYNTGAIRELHEVVLEKEAEIQELKRKYKSLEARLEMLERRVLKQNAR
jgi:hypothetical protein